jgi:hypothetical protein
MAQLQYRLMGALFGFPACCVQAFCATCCTETKTRYPRGPWMGTGFIPCLSCAPKALNLKRFVAEEIAPNRLCAAPFPGEFSPETQDAALMLIANLGLDADDVFSSPWP